MSQINQKKSRGTEPREVQKVQCANCFACKKDTELCPLNENYSPDAYLKWEEKYLQRRQDKV